MFDQYLKQCAAVYRAMPVNGSKDTCASHSVNTLIGWQELGADCRDRAAGIRLLLDVRETSDDEPYAGPGEMLAEIQQGLFVVSTANSDHPLWDAETNVAFRIVHDVLGHYAASLRLGYPNNDPESTRPTVAGFDWAGENLACKAHVPLLPSWPARMALWVECLAQTASAIADGWGFIEPQKVGDPIPYLITGLPFGDAYLAWLNGNTQ